ncbi:hypothetical protein GCM10010249_60020 [Streptomyces roseolilacinus]|uniref:Uncharacterized protein n=1 Tax=Streptomyces roseolilacinus TaxID=66904 RepID=A0A918B644_9ACTN|nr:hypothetical protein GCM10010249_60020 [Streptomyces roseolilacinus]
MSQLGPVEPHQAFPPARVKAWTLLFGFLFHGQDRLRLWLATDNLPGGTAADVGPSGAVTACRAPPRLPPQDDRERTSGRCLGEVLDQEARVLTALVADRPAPPVVLLARARRAFAIAGLVSLALAEHALSARDAYALGIASPTRPGPYSTALSARNRSPPTEPTSAVARPDASGGVRHFTGEHVVREVTERGGRVGPVPRSYALEPSRGDLGATGSFHRQK